MSQLETVSLTLVPIIFQNVPCISTSMLANAYEVSEDNIRNNYSNNKSRFIEGKHYFFLNEKDVSDLRNLKTDNLYPQNLRTKTVYPQISSRARRMIIWTERGAARHAKMLNSDKAWDVFEMLEECFFRTAEEKPKSAPVPVKKPAPALPLHFSGIRAFFDEYDKELYLIEEKIKALDAAYIRNTNPLIQTVAKQIAHPFAADAVIETMHLRQREITESAKSLREKMLRQRQFLLALLSKYANA